jgi:hypothetical protein
MYRQALLLVRVYAFVSSLVGFTMLLANVAQSFDTFVPTYAGFYFKQQLARPIIIIAVSIVIAFLARPLARLLARGTEE